MRIKLINGLLIIVLTTLIFFLGLKSTDFYKDRIIASFILFTPLVSFTFFKLGRAVGFFYLLILSFLSIKLFEKFSLGNFFPLLGINFVVGLISAFDYSIFLKDIKKNRVKISNLKERIEIVSKEVKEKSDLKEAFSKKFDRFFRLKVITDEISLLLNLDKIIQTAGEKLFEIIPKAEISLLYLIGDETEDLGKPKIVSFYYSKRRKILSEKVELDIFDYWLLREKGNLLISDIRRDFRFSVETVEEISRDFVSLLACPIILKEKVFGVIRLESCEAGVFTSDDLLLLDMFSDLLAVGIENAYLYQKTEELANRDGLTNLYLPRYLYRRLDELLEKSGEFSILMLDLDYFKDYNDRYGHIAGDIMLKKIAQLLLESVSRNDFVVRYGGEEFLIVLVNRKREEAVRFAEEIRKKVEEEVFYLRREATRVTVSIGVSVYPYDGKTKEELIHKADEWLYFAKTKGRNRVGYLGMK